MLAEKGKAQIIFELLPWIKNQHPTDLAGWTPLHLAALYGKREVAEAYVQRSCHSKLNKEVIKFL